MKPKPKPLRWPVDISSNCHYYEGRRGVSVYISSAGLPHTFSAEIPWKKLIESAKRCRPEDVK